MKSLCLKRKTFIALILLVLVIFIVSCAPNADEPIISPQLGAILAAREAGEIVSVMPTPTPVLFATLSEEQVYAGLPEDVMAAIAAADPGRAPTIALANACVGCHNLDPSVALQGPTWYQMGETAANRVGGESPALYLYQSITDPSAYVVPGYADNVMPKTFSQTLSTQDLADIIAYLLTQHE